MDVAGDPVLYIDFTQVSSWSVADERDTLVRCLDWEPAVSVQADVSGRHQGDDEVRSFVCGLMEAFEGLAQDEYTDHCWSREQILSGESVQDHPFFDYQGWYESQHMGTE